MADDRATIQIRIPVALRDRLAAHAVQRDTSMSFLARRAIERWLDAPPPLPGEPVS